jgi:hypothetical protein
MNGTSSGGTPRLMTMKRVIGVTAAGGAALLTVAACGTTHVTPGGAGAAPAGTKSASAATTSVTTPQQRADADASSILGSFAVPPGAVRLSAAPASVTELAHPSVVFATTDVVDHVSWWKVPGKPQTVLAWEKAHVPAQFKPTGSGTVGSPATMWAEQFSLPAVAGVLSTRELSVQAVSIADGQTALRVDGDVAWIPAKPASERVPATAKVVTVTVLRGMVATVKIPKPVTITDPTKVRELIDAANALPLWSQQHLMCPADFGESVRLTFSATSGGPAVAVAVADVGGCGLANLTVNGKSQLPLSGGATLARTALTAAGLGALSTGREVPTPGKSVNPGGPMIP